MSAASPRVSGTLQVPGDKSISHRALMFAALATGASRVRGILQSADVSATAGALRALGWSVPELGTSMSVEGRGLHSRLPSPVSRLDCENSGTTARLMAGIAAAQPGVSEFDGDASLRTRPMRRVSEPLEAMGAGFEWLDADGRLPMRVRGGALRSIEWSPAIASAQVKSAILLAGLCGRVPVRVSEPLPSRDHTERLLESLGAPVQSGHGVVTLQPVDVLPPLDLDVPGDPSSAAFFAALAAGATAGSLTLTGVLLNPHRIGFARVLARMGARISSRNERISSGEPVGDLVVEGRGLQGTAIAPAEIPSLIDEIPMLAAVAALAHGDTIVTGASELRVKESDRIATVVANLRACGVDAEELPDGLVVRGPAALRDAAIVTHGDHRIAMAFAVLAALTMRDLRIDEPASVSVSYPSFWSDLARVTH
ncbi:MAG: 3-phosphoshikimate 1-carboxyvinyltransferase [Gemmatimonadaceae bacterium]